MQVLSQLPQVRDRNLLAGGAGNVMKHQTGGTVRELR